MLGGAVLMFANRVLRGVTQVVRQRLPVCNTVSRFGHIGGHSGRRPVRNVGNAFRMW